MTFTIDGKPQGKGRPRFTGKRAYTPPATKAYEELVQWQYKSQCGNKKLNGYIAVFIQAWFPIPKNTSKKNRELMLSGKLRPDKTPDVDNISKIILDALNGIAYDDDKQVVDLNVDKYYSEEPHVWVRLFEV